MKTTYKINEKGEYFRYTCKKRKKKEKKDKYVHVLHNNPKYSKFIIRTIMCRSLSNVLSYPIF